jgi:hypothetical protein
LKETKKSALPDENSISLSQDLACSFWKETALERSSVSE